MPLRSASAARACGIVAEHDRRHRGPIERAVVADDVLPEALRHPRQHRRVRRLQVAGDLVGVDDHGTVLGEHRRDGRLSGSDAAGQADQQHV